MTLFHFSLSLFCITLSIYFFVSVMTMRIHPSCTVKKECMLERFEYFKWKREGTTEMNTSYHIDNEVPRYMSIQKLSSLRMMIFLKISII